MSKQTDPELWRPIPSVPSYIASTHGRIMKIPYRKEGGRAGERPYGGTPTRGQWDGKRYIACIEGKTFRVARLVCEAFHGPQPKPYPESVCIHLDENSRNNRPENLRWASQKENLNAPGFLAYCRSRTGESSPTVKARARRMAGGAAE